MPPVDTQQKPLRGWKEIAAHVGRDVRTVQRWEQRGLPVRRVPGAERGNVYALASEVDAWLHPSLVQPGPIEPLLDPEPSSVPSSVALEPAGVPRWLLYVGAFAAASLMIAIFSAYRVHFHQRAAGTEEGSAARRIYTSPVAGVDALYLQAMYLFGQRTPESLISAQRLLETAVRRDPNDSAAWAGLAEVCTIAGAYNIGNSSALKGMARNAAEQALTLNPTLSEPHAVLGFIDFFWTGQPAAAERDFQAALHLNPRSPLALSWYGTMLTYEARYPEALEQLTAAQQLDPASTPNLSAKALALGLSGHRDEAVRLLQDDSNKDPIASVRYDLAILALVPPRNIPLYLSESQQLSAVAHDEKRVQVFQAAQHAYLQAGEAAMWQEIAAQHGAGVDPGTLLQAYVALGQRDAALELIESMEANPSTLMALPMDPLLLPLHDDPRFERALRSVGLPIPWKWK